jgi:hypothetical protein
MSICAEELGDNLEQVSHKDCIHPLQSFYPDSEEVTNTNKNGNSDINNNVSVFDHLLKLA